MPKSKSQSKPTESKKAKAQAKSKEKSKSLELIHVLMLFFALFSFIALIGFDPHAVVDETEQGFLGKIGNVAAFFLSISLIGRWGSLVIPITILFGLIGIWSNWRFNPFKYIVSAIFFGFMFSMVLGLIRFWNGIKPEFIEVGFLPYLLCELGVNWLKPLGTSLVLIFLMFVFAILVYNISAINLLSLLFYKSPLFAFNQFRSLIGWLSNFQGTKRNEEDKDMDVEDDIDDDWDKDKSLDNKKPFDDDLDDDFDSELEPALSRSQTQLKTENTPKLQFAKAAPFTKKLPLQINTGERQLPPIELLNEIPFNQPKISEVELLDNSRKLEEKLKHLGITARVIKTVPGPIITRYDLEPAADVKIARIVSIADDIAMALRAPGVRILAPIPGEAAVGVEIPNKNPATIMMREVVWSEEFRDASKPLIIALGKNASGDIYCTDLARMPHLLIAGATGSGKSVCINVIICSILYRCDPDNVRFVLVDPKKLELSLYARLSQHHLVAPPNLGEEVITTPENALLTLRSVHLEMARRYDILQEAGVRSLDEYHKWLKSTPPSDENEEDTREKLPYLIVVVDELADLMMVLRREFEELVARLAQMSRAVGIHMIVATQRPSVDVITGLIKANFPSRIAFKVASKFDSRTILDGMGAESLLGRGDMLFQGPGAQGITRLHGALINTEEVEQIVEFVRSQPPAKIKFTLPDPTVEQLHLKFSGSGNGGGESSVDSDFDELFNEAAKIVVRTEQGSISVLQRRLRIGYARAARLVDQLEQAGVVGPFDGSKARAVIMTPEELKERWGIE